MQSISLYGAAAALLLLVSGSALAAPATLAPFRGEATLATPVPAPLESVVAGVTWRCEGATCVGVAARSSTLDGHVRECRKLAAAVGPLSGYASRGRELTKGNLKACNAAAAPLGGESLAAQK